VDAVGICNMALGWLGAGTITALTEASTLGELCAANFNPVRDAVLEERAWRFATQRRSVAADPVAPAYGAAYRYLIPSQVIRVLEVSDGADQLLDWQREGDYVITDQASPIYLRSVERVDDTARWTPGFTMSMATRLAATLAITLTENRALQADLWSLYARRLQEAGAKDGMQGRGRFTTNDWLRRARG
jgi:hypothetical protein